MTNLFESVPINEVQAILIKNIQEKAAELYQAIEVTENSRERSSAITNLEQSVMWAVKNVSRNPPSDPRKV